MLRYLKRKPLFYIAIAILYLANSSSHPTSNGGYTAAPGDGVCAQCHNDNNASFMGEILIDGLPSTVTQGQMYPLTITVTNTNLNVNRAGFQITALNASNAKSGNFSGAGSNSSIKSSGGRQYFGHSPAVQFNGNSSLTWDVTWTAPSSGSGDVTFYCASILGSGSNGNQDDKFIVNQFQTNLSAGPLSTNIINVSDVTCYNGNNGIATASPSGGTTPYEYEWSNGQLTQTANTLTAGLATVTVTDNAGVTATASVTISEPSELFMTGSNIVDPVCFNSFNGSISVTVTGGETPYFYDWSNGASGSTISNLGPGSYSLTVTDDNDCTFVENFSLTAPAAIVINNSTVQNVSCFGLSNGAVQINVSGGSGSLEFDWSNGATSQNLNNVPAGNYTVTITDDNNCGLDQEFIITQPTLLNPSIAVNTNIVCNGNSTGSLTASAIGGTSPYSYKWSNNATSATISNLPFGTYTVTITDNKSCTSTKIQTLNNPPLLTSSVSSTTNASCTGVNNGSATISITGGVSPYNTNWNNGLSGTQINNLAVGNYIYTVTDNLGCTKTGSVTISSNQTAELVEDNVTNLLCFGDNNGSISIIANNATGYNIVWSNGGNGTSINNLTAGTYTVQASNSQGCLSNELVLEITQPEAILLLQDLVENVSCFGLSDGSISTSYQGGIGVLHYLWNTNDSTSTIDSLIAETYTLIVSDDNGCDETKTYTLTQPPAILVDSSFIQNLSCFNDNNGSIQLFASGGNGGLNAIWSNGDFGNIADSLTVGNHSVIITDNDNCSVLDTFTVTAPVPIQIEAEVINESAENLNDGSITTNVNNGIPPYEYLWSTGDTTSAIDSLTPGLYELTITDSTGCEQYAQYNIQIGNCALAASFEVLDVSCFGGNDGQIIFSPSNGTAPFTITPSPDSLSAGSYSFSIVDSSNCSIAVSNILVLQPNALSINLDTIIAATGSANDDGEIRITVLGGTKPYNFIWTDSTGTVVDSIEDPESLVPGEYTLFLLDANECELDSIIFEVSFTSSNIEIVENFIKIYPNPATNRLYLESTIQEFRLQVFDINGKLIDKYDFNSYRNNIDISNYNSGMYLLRIIQGENIITKKISID